MPYKIFNRIELGKRRTSDRQAHLFARFPPRRRARRGAYARYPSSRGQSPCTALWRGLLSGRVVVLLENRGSRHLDPVADVPITAGIADAGACLLVIAAEFGFGERRSPTSSNIAAKLKLNQRSYRRGRDLPFQGAANGGGCDDLVLHSANGELSRGPRNKMAPLGFSPPA